MIITVRQAIKMMKKEYSFVRRFNSQGYEMPRAIEWNPDDYWSTCKHDGISYYILENPSNQTIHHVEV